MKIAASEMSFASAHTRQNSVDRRLQINIAGPAAPARETVTLSQAGLAAAAEERSDEEMALPPRLELLKSLLERMMGREIRLGHFMRKHISPAEREASESRPVAAAQGLSVSYSEHREESEHLRVEVQGAVQTSDGQKISFSLSLALDRSWTQDLELDVSTGKMLPRKKDPLVINFNGTAAELGSGRFDFDLDADGQLESVPLLGAGSSFLVLDRNGDGRINDGSELFGTRSGDGFADLSSYDADHNGWIDENDAVYARLKTWQPDASGEGVLHSLAESDVGAIALTRVASAYEYRDGSNTPLASLKSTGVYLKDSGGAGSVQQLDLVV